MAVKIEKDKPVPKGRVIRPWPEMEVGDTIVIEKRLIGAANEWARRNAEKLGELRRFTSEAITDEKDKDYGKYRIGRIE